MKGKYTPAPWYIYNHGNYSTISYGLIRKCICDNVRNEANANLISAAPDMYEALVMCRNAMATLAQDSEPAMNAFMALVNALTKAEGGQNV